MKNLAIRVKLTLLAGIPIIGALVLAFQIVRDAQVQVQKNKSLGTIEHVARLSETMGRLVGELQKERALAARIQGQRAEAGKKPANSVETELGPQSGNAIHGAIAQTEGFRKQSELTLAAEDSLHSLVSRQEIGRLPERLAVDVRTAREGLQDLQEHRRGVEQDTFAFGTTVERYDRPIRALIEGIAALSELTDNGELLRLTTSLVSVMQLKERGSQEHALLAYVLEFGSFPPGSYRALVTLTTEEAVYLEAFKTTASSDQVNLYNRAVAHELVERTRRMRASALETTDDKFTLDPDEWFRVQQEKLTQVAAVERELHRRVGAVALERIAETKRAEWGSASLIGAVILVSVLLAWVVARGVTQRVTDLRNVAEQVGRGNLAIRVGVSSTDELGRLGSAFNEMIEELGRARASLSNQIRMARELEIASSLQRALLPPSPAHPDFEFAGRMQPADEVGGDFYDVLREGDANDLWVTVGDVSGHGLDAGLVMLMTQSAFAAQFRADPNTKPSDTLRNVNRLLCENIAVRLRDKKYVTAQVMAYRGNGHFLCAGAHQPIITYRAATRQCEVVQIEGPWLGIDPTIVDIPQVELELGPGDILCLYTDGLPEARNDAGDLFDQPRFVELINETASRCTDLDEIADAIFRAVGEHSRIHDDDWTMLLVRRRADSPAVQFAKC